MTEPPQHTAPPPKQATLLPKQEVVFLSDEAWHIFTTETERLRYTGRASYLGVGAYLQALLRANPLYTDWRDTRPHDVTKFDKHREAAYMSKMWFRYNLIGASASENAPAGSRNAGRRFIMKRYYDAALPFLLELSTAHEITHPHQRYRIKQTPKSMATAVLEAIGLGYLSPMHACPPCETPANPTNRRSGRNKKRWAMVF